MSRVSDLELTRLSLSTRPQISPQLKLLWKPRALLSAPHDLIRSALVSSQYRSWPALWPELLLCALVGLVTGLVLAPAGGTDNLWHGSGEGDGPLLLRHLPWPPPPAPWPPPPPWSVLERKLTLRLDGLLIEQSTTLPTLAWKLTKMCQR